MTDIVVRLAAMRGGDAQAGRVTLRSAISVTCAAVAFIALSLGSGLPRGEAVSAQGESSLGEHLYLRDCASCHGPAGEGTSRGVPLLDTGEAGAHFYLSTGRMPISEPGEEVARSEPAYRGAALDALVSYVASLGDGPPVPDLELEGGDVALGGVLYRQHCAQCHGSSGVGVALAAGVTAPRVLEATPLQVAESLAVGPGAMPVFHPAILDDRDVAAVVAYLSELQDPTDRGGLPLARSGRLDEMLVAWGIGVAAAVLLARRVARP